MSYGYLGVVDKIFGENDHLASIRPLARLIDDGRRRDLTFSPGADLGETGRVFLTGGADDLDLQAGQPVRFDAEENPRPSSEDRFMVSKSGRLWRIERDDQSLRVVAAETLVATGGARQLRLPPPSIGGRHLYVRWADRIEGPWRVEEAGSSLLPVRGGVYKDKRVFSFPLESLDPAVYVEDAEARGVEGYLLQELDPLGGEPRDLATGEQLAKWFLKLANQDAGLQRVLHRLDREHPGWRQQFRQSLDDQGDEIDRRIYRGRLERLDAIVETLDLGEEALRALSETEAFFELWTKAVEQRRAELEDEARREWEQERLDLESDRSRLVASVEDLRREQRTLLAEREKKAEVLRELRDHLDSERGRLLHDLAIFQKAVGLESSTQTQNPDREAKTGVERLLALRPTSQKAELETVSSERFAREILPESLASLGLPRGDAVLVHAAILACPAHLLPAGLWSRAYAQSLGPAARFLLLEVKPHWISFRELWQAGLAAAVDTALERPSDLVLLHLQDLDRSLPELWLRPVLDVLAGLRDSLPSGDRWPPNFRLTVSRAADGARLPLCLSTLLHFAAPLQPEAGREEMVEMPDSSPCCTPAWTWNIGTALGASSALTDPFRERLVSVPPALRRTVCTDVGRLAQALASLVSRPAADLVDKALELRLDNPALYLEEADEH